MRTVSKIHTAHENEKEGYIRLTIRELMKNEAPTDPHNLSSLYIINDIVDGLFF